MNVLTRVSTALVSRNISVFLEIKLTLALNPYLPEKWEVQSQVKLSLLGDRGHLVPSWKHVGHHHSLYHPHMQKNKRKSYCLPFTLRSHHSMARVVMNQKLDRF